MASERFSATLLMLGSLALAGMAVAGGAWWSAVPLPETARQLVHWMPALLAGFGLNIGISALALVTGTVFGVLLGALLVLPLGPLRLAARLYVQVFRNAPKLVLVYFASYVFPFEVQFGEEWLSFPDWLKVAAGLGLAAAGYMAEILRGAVQSIPRAQWEAGFALGMRRWQVARGVILPQCLRRMLPPWTNLVAIITMASALASLVGAHDLLATAQVASATVHATPFTVVVYLTVLTLFFACCWPLARLTRALEARLAG